MEEKRGNIRGQVAIFIIIALIIISVLLVFFLYVRPTYIIPGEKKLKLELCMEDVISNSVKEISLKGGLNNPEFTYSYKGGEMTYLCYTNLYYAACVNQRPFLIEGFSEELLNNAQDEIFLCYDNSLDELKSQGYQVVSGGKNLSIELQPGKIVATLNAPVVLEKGSAKAFTNFIINVNSNIYNMLAIATSIVQSETATGDADVTGLMGYYPDLIIDKLKQGEETVIYIIEDKNSKTKFQFAVRSFAFPAGYGLNTGLDNRI